MRKIILLLSVALILCIGYMRYASVPERWVVYYDKRLAPEVFLPFDVIVFDRQGHPPLAPIKERQKILLGYLSLGEAETFRDNYQWIQDHQLILETGPEWKGNPVIDVRKPEWEAYVLKVLVPETVNRGFDGVMLDTADSVIWLEHTQPQKYTGMQDALVRIIKQMRARYPDMKIMLNRGFPLLEKVGGDIDMVLAESIYPTSAAQSNTSPPLPDESYQNYVTMLIAAQKKVPYLKIYTLDYLEKDNIEGMKNIYKTQRQQGFIPYVGPSGLQAILAEPE